MPIAVRREGVTLMGNAAFERWRSGEFEISDGDGVRTVRYGNGHDRTAFALELPLTSDGLKLVALLDPASAPAVLANVPAFLFATDGSGRVVFVSEEFYRVTGLCRDASPDWTRVVHPDDIAVLSATREKAIQERRDYCYDLRVRRSDGQYRRHRVHGVMRSEGGGSARWYGVVVDVEELFQAQEALRDNEARFQAMLEAVPDAVVVCSAEGVVEAFSPGAENLFERTAGDVLGMNVSDLAPYATTAKTGAREGNLPSAGVIGSAGVRQITIRRPSGAHVPVELRVRQIQMPEHPAFVGVFRDLTSAHEADRRLRVKRAELAHVSRLSAMGEMAATLAHETNQPLAAAANFIKAAERLLPADNEATGRARGLLASAAEQILNAGEIMRRMRSFVHKPQPAPSLHDLRDIVAEAAELALMGARETGVNITYDFAGGARLVMAEQLQIQQVIVNLIRNALEALEGAPLRQLHIGVTDDRTSAILCVKDTGPGVAEDVRTGIFEPFLTTKAQGVGVGLAISRTIVEAHGGRIWFEPNEGGGAAFYFSLPLLQQEKLHDD